MNAPVIIDLIVSGSLGKSNINLA